MRFFDRGLVACALLAATVCWAQTDTSQPQSRTEIEAHARELDSRAVQLQHEIMAARHDGDAAALERAEGKLKATQTERVETLRTLGVFP
jgi:C4-dicarboxylate-specific signal transduction histidine kinase